MVLMGIIIAWSKMMKAKLKCATTKDTSLSSFEETGFDWKQTIVFNEEEHHNENKKRCLSILSSDF